MGRKGGSKHLKRLSAPDFWPIHVKRFTWATKPRPGPHPATRAIPLSTVLREILGYTKTRYEAKMTIAEGTIKVDGKIRRDDRYPVGLMDVVEIPDAKSVFRVVPFPARGLFLLKITKDEGGFKLCQINDKTSTKSGKLQLNLNDGRNLTLQQEPGQPGEPYTARDTIQLAVPSQKILGHIRFAEGKYGLVVAGRNIGRHGKIVGIEKTAASRRAAVKIQDAQGQTFQTVADYVYAIGDDQPIIKLPEA